MNRSEFSGEKRNRSKRGVSKRTLSLLLTVTSHRLSTIRRSSEATLYSCTILLYLHCLLRLSLRLLHLDLNQRTLEPPPLANSYVRSLSRETEPHFSLICFSWVGRWYPHILVPLKCNPPLLRGQISECSERKVVLKIQQNVRLDLRIPPTTESVGHLPPWAVDLRFA